MDSLVDLLDQVRLLWHVMERAAEQLHGSEPVSLGMRAVLEFLERSGSATVPGIARSRQVTRQHVQTLVNALRARKLVALGKNPAHRRSALVQLTPAGRQAIKRMTKRELSFLHALELQATGDDIRRATETLKDVRMALGGRQ